MKQLKQSTIKKYNVKQLCKHLDRYQREQAKLLYRFDFQFNTIHKLVYSDIGYLKYYEYECNIHDYYREEVIDILNNIYSLNIRYFVEYKRYNK